MRIQSIQIIAADQSKIECIDSILTRPARYFRGSWWVDMEGGGATAGNADWMSQLPEELWDMSLWDLAIPGSHDSMTYCLDTCSPVLSSESLLKWLDRLVPCITRPCIYRWATTQVWCITDQLDAGIRYFDLRIAHKNIKKTCFTQDAFNSSRSDDTLYFAHAIYTLQTVKEALTSIAVWLEQHQKEIVILSCSHFYELSDGEHEALVSFITLLFGDKLCPRQETPSLSKCWSLGQQVIASYEDVPILKEHKELWPKIPYWYANSPDPQRVISYLEDMQRTQGRPANFFVSGLNLTTYPALVVCHPYLTLRKLTMKSFPLLLNWVVDQTPGPDNTSVNIICADFVGLTEFASVVINLNKKLQKTKDHR
ncbi:PI-PLC X domain-containing protein 1-like [Esox lucius]|uniref:Phosphatidylinositol-specific phospholipase C X domain-containing protein n=1 Tax=Esox lucius TaxID=8010 RepID=A0AAY5K633_ESOLU|nr:PI-PLC X domain-containing protein 1-like [Esox lucius]XP_010862321.1 PI-PLC X domain-containing protein 1-like [Esox lucius]